MMKKATPYGAALGICVTDVGAYSTRPYPLWQLSPP
jgi:hypothetical protein